jgi:hypothetical protein
MASQPLPENKGEVTMNEAQAVAIAPQTVVPPDMVVESPRFSATPDSAGTAIERARLAIQWTFSSAQVIEASDNQATFRPDKTYGSPSN